MVATRKYIIVACLVWAVLLSFASLVIPPAGEIDSSVLILIAQVLLLVATCVGINLPTIITNHEPRVKT